MKNYENIYMFTPCNEGLKIRFTSANDIRREYCCTLFPDCNRNLVYTKEQLEKMQLFAFRPVILAGLTPKYSLDLHCVAGHSGYGRFAVTSQGESFWLDECADISAEYKNGEMHYSVVLDKTNETVKISILPADSFAGTVICADCENLNDDTEIYFVHGGFLGADTQGQYVLPYSPNACYNNFVSINQKDGFAEISIKKTDYDVVFEKIEPYIIKEELKSDSSAWKKIENFEQKIAVYAETPLFIAHPDLLSKFSKDLISGYKTAKNGLVCTKLGNGKKNYIAVGKGENIKTENISRIYELSHAKNLEISGGLYVNSASEEFNGSVKMAAASTEGIFGDNVYLHGAVSWRNGYIGWRTLYGPLAFGKFAQSKKHIENHLEHSFIKNDADKGGFVHMIEWSDRCNEVLFYNMAETFIDQTKRYWEFTGDKDFARKLLPVVKDCIDRQERRLKPDTEQLFENSVNTWISDGHWTIFGQCTQSSAYMYNMYRLAADLSESEDEKAHFEKTAQKVKEDMHRVLWQKEKGVFAYAKDKRGNCLLHTEPELPDIYHPAEFGVTDKYENYSMLYWAEQNLPFETADNGAKLYWSSNWHPNSEDSYTHSTFELALSEELNLALIYFGLGMCEKGYELFKGAYMSQYCGRDDGIFDHDDDKYLSKGYPPTLKTTAGDLYCHLTTNGTPRRNSQFSDTISMYGRTVLEGLLGIKPRFNKNEIEIIPCLPKELLPIEVKTAFADYTYKKGEGEISFEYKIHRENCKAKIGFFIEPSEILAVKLNGKSLDYSTEAFFGRILVTVSLENACCGRLTVDYKLKDLSFENEIISVRSGEEISLDFAEEEIMQLLDFQSVLQKCEISGGKISATVGGTNENAVFFLKIRLGNTEYIRPVKLKIQAECQNTRNLFLSPEKEFGKNLKFKTICMDNLFNASSPDEVLEKVISTALPLPKEYSQVNIGYYKDQLCQGNKQNPALVMSDERWKSLVNSQNTVVTGEGIPFLSNKTGNYMAAATLSASAYPEKIVIPANCSGKALYLLVTGITFPMQSHVENARVIINYQSGKTEEFPLVSPFDIGDMWFTFWGRYHDTAGAGFENLAGNHGEMSSKGLDLTKSIPTDTEAHILRFKLKENETVETVEFKIIANDVVFAVMGLTFLE